MVKDTDRFKIHKLRKMSGNKWLAVKITTILEFLVFLVFSCVLLCSLDGSGKYWPFEISRRLGSG